MTDRPPLAVLAGVRVLSFTQFLLGPSGVQFLADLGADVIKVEPPAGRLWERNWSGANLYLNGVSVFYLAAHRNQRSLALDLKHPEGRAVARRLVERADVLVQNFRPGVMARLGLGWEEVRAINPRLIYVSASAYGESHPRRDRPGQDLLMQAVSGLASISGRRDQPPTPVGTAVVDQHGAALLALGVLAALLERARTGRGLHVEVSMLRAALDLQLEIAAYVLNGARLEKTATPLASMFHPPPYGVYATQDGWLALSLTPLADLRDALELPELEPYARERWAYEAREAVALLLEPVLRQRTTAEWLERLLPRGIWAAPVRTLPEALADPAVAAAEAVEEFVHPVAGPVRLLRFPVELSTGRATVRRPPPAPGEHSEEILREHGYTSEAVARLRQAGVI
ncbi:MAG TPA: CaiB/BaiF CoA-transferase family protein [Candidatus Binatia bacterium]|nr:CaiB/BaiF CoA-transferase family protein [Candidatus Binatia bacterium]